MNKTDLNSTGNTNIKETNSNTETKFTYLENLITTELLRALQDTRPDAVDQSTIQKIEEKYTFPQNTQSDTSLLDYLRLKVKERILELLILEATLIFDSEKEYLISDAEMYQYYYDLCNYNLEALHTSFSTHNSFDPIIYRSIRSEDLEVKVKSTARTDHKPTIQYRHDEFAKKVENYAIPKRSLQRIQLEQSTYYIDADSFNLHALVVNYLKPFGEDFFKSNLAFLHYTKENHRPEKSRKKLNELIHFSPFTAFVVLNFGSNSTIFNKCTTLNYIICDKEADSKCLKCLTEINNLYQDHIETAVNLLDSLVALHGQDSHTALCTDIHFSNILHYQFFESIESPLFKYCTRHIDFAELVEFGRYAKSVKSDDINAIETITDSYGISESFFYLSFLLLCMKFHINLDDLEKYQLRKCTPQKGFIIVDESKECICYTPAVTVNINTANDKIQSFNSTLKFIVNFLHRSESMMGSILQTYLEENSVIVSQDESKESNVKTDKLGNLLHECIEELKKLRNGNTYLYRGKVCENKFPNDMPEYINEDLHASTRYSIDSKEQKNKINFMSCEKNTAHILSFLLKHPTYSSMPNL